MPKRFAITVQQHPQVAGNGDLLIHSDVLDLPRQASGELNSDEDSQPIVDARWFLTHPADARIDGARFILRLASDVIPETLFDRISPLRTQVIECRSSILSHEDATLAMCVASLGIPIRIEYTPRIPEAWGGLLDYFLHSPALQVPVEPFYTLACTHGEGRSETLRELFEEQPGRHFFVDATRRVALSRRYAADGQFLGTVDEFDHTALTQAEYQVAHAREQVFRDRTACAFCRHYPSCQGFWMSTPAPDKACQPWHCLMDELAEAGTRCGDGG